jgi:hypothetical protein
MYYLFEKSTIDGLIGGLTCNYQKLILKEFIKKIEKNAFDLDDENDLELMSLKFLSKHL